MCWHFLIRSWIISTTWSGPLQEFREELAHLRSGSATQLEQLPDVAAVCGIVERKIHAKGELALTWLEGHGRAKKSAR